MSDEAGLLDAIVREPEDDFLRLVYADWLEENGHSARAEFIRVQIELARGSPDDEKRRKLEKRERSLLLKHERKWGKSHPREWMCPLYRRGFVECVTTHTVAFLDDPEGFLSVAPLRCLDLLEARDHSDELATCGELSWLTGLGLSGIGAAGLDAVLTSLEGSGLRELDASANALEGDDLLGQLGERLPCLERLSLANNALESPRWIESLGEPLLLRLRSLDLSGNRYLPRGTLPLLGERAIALEALALNHIPYLATAIDDLASKLPSLRLVLADHSVTRLDRYRLRVTYPRIKFRFGELAG